MLIRSRRFDNNKPNVGARPEVTPANGDGIIEMVATQS
jgi:hypothetical protein